MLASDYSCQSDGVASAGLDISEGKIKSGVNE